MSEINSLLNAVEIKACKDTWRPWRTRDQGGKKVGSIDQRPSMKPNLKGWKMETVPQVGWEKSSGSELKNNDELKLLTAEVLPPRVRGRPPRVEVDGDDVDMLDPKAAVMKMLRDAKDQQGKIEPQGELSLDKKKKNKEIWRKEKLERVKKEKVSVNYWVRNGNFIGLIDECGPQGVREAVIKDMWHDQAGDFLYKELESF